MLDKVTAESCFNIHSFFLSLYYSYYSLQSLRKLITDKLLWAHTCLGHLAPIISSCMQAQLLQSCLTLCSPMDCSPPGSSVHGILQVRILEWVVMPSSRGSSWPRNPTWVSCIAGRFFTHWATREVWSIICPRPIRNKWHSPDLNPESLSSVTVPCSFSKSVSHHLIHGHENIVTPRKQW